MQYKFNPFTGNLDLTENPTDYATADQGLLADTALQPSALNNTALTGIPTAPTATTGTNNTQIATTEFVLANAVGGGGIINGAIVNGVANFWQSTPPLARIDDSALVDGDTWYNPTNQRQWFRRGIYWVGQQEKIEIDYLGLNLTSGTNYRLAGVFPANYLMESLTGQIFGSSDANNYCVYSVGQSSGGQTIIFYFTNRIAVPGYVNESINLVYLNSIQRTPLFRVEARVGSPPGTNISACFVYREIYA